MTTSLRDIRATFLNFFGERDHEVVPSSPLVPDDPTLLFTNAGMVPFKGVFTGAEPAKFPRAVSSQKCVRAGGKHNDLDNVGYTARHHTFFEMLGNFSFGDYFKERAIELAWTLVTTEYGLDADRLLVTVYAEDDEAHGLWRKIASLPDERIIRIATSDNFWSMGPVGPCGPCSEIFFDHGPEIPGGPPGSPDEDGDRFVEIWNLVFMQFNQAEDGSRANLPKPSIDTGMGLERVAAVLQGVHSNYDTDLFRALIGASEEALSVKAEGEAAASHRVIADHLRATSFLIADGVSPSNEGRGYVLRRIMRRAMRHAHVLGAKEPVIYSLVPELVTQMGEAFPELTRAQAAIEDTLRQEEERFQRTLGRGMSILEEAAADLSEGQALAGATAFKLYDTYGFPVDLTQDVLRPRGISVDLDGFNAELDKQKEKGRESWSGSGDAMVNADWAQFAVDHGETEFLGYAKTKAKSELLVIFKNGSFTRRASPGDEVQLVFKKTPFYAEGGGQIGDAGTARARGIEVAISDVRKAAGVYVHQGRVTRGTIEAGQTLTLEIDTDRREATMANHSATHLLHAALRRTLGPHVTQKGSYVGPDRLRFDFSHGQPVTQAELTAIEDEVNTIIRSNAAAKIEEMAPAKAIEAGALALFGEKYGDRVRVLTLGKDPDNLRKPYSVELCGGTHVARTGDVGVFKIVGESGVAAGVRRIEALTGEGAKVWFDEKAAKADRLASLLKTPLDEAEDRLRALLEERKSLERALAEAKKQLALGGGGASAFAPEDVAGIKLIAKVADGVGGKDLRAMIDQAKDQLGSGVAAFVGVNDGKAALAVGVTEDLAGKVDARDLVRAGAEAVGGKGGGGRPDMAQAGGPNGVDADKAIIAIREALAAARSEAV